MKTEVIHSEITKLAFGTGTLEVEPTKFQVRDTTASRKVADFSLELFGKHLVHTPVSAVGLNYDVEFEVPDFKVRDRIGYALAPAEPWGPLVKSLKSDKGGLLSLILRAPIDDDRYLERYHDIRVLPHLSEKKRFFVRVNSHYQIAKKEEPVSIGPVVEKVLSEFDKQMQIGREISEHVWNLGMK